MNVTASIRIGLLFNEPRAIAVLFVLVIREALPSGGIKSEPKASTVLYLVHREMQSGIRPAFRTLTVPPPFFSLPIPAGAIAPKPQPSLLLHFPGHGRSAERKDHHPFPRYRADVVVQADHLHSRDLMNQCLNRRPCRFDQMRPHLF